MWNFTDSIEQSILEVSDEYCNQMEQRGFNVTKGAQTSVLLREAALDSRLEALREVALSLLNEVESLQRSQPPHPDRKVRLQDEVRQFEIDLIRTTLDRTSGRSNSRRAIAGRY